MMKAIQFLVIVLSLLTGASGGGGRCPRVPSMTAQQACSSVCGTRRMHVLCLRTLLPRRGGGAAAVTVHAGVAASSALGSYTAAAAAARREMQSYGAAVPDGEKAAHVACMSGYDVASRAMSRVADDLASCGTAASLTQDYMDSLAGMDACWKGVHGYPASPMYGRNLADRNKTLLAALLCSLVPRPPERRGALDAHMAFFN